MHLRDKIIQQFKYMAKSYNKWRREEEEVDAQAVAAAEREAEEGVEIEIEELQFKLTTAAMRSRVTSVSVLDTY